MPTESDPPNYWVSRLDQALGNAQKAQSQRTRLAYLELARHYALMQALMDGRSGKAIQNWVAAADAPTPAGGSLHELRNAA